MRGDTVLASVFAKYLERDTTLWDNGNGLATLMNTVRWGTPAAGVLIDGGTAGTTGGVTPPYAALLAKGQGTQTGAPKAYLNFLVFDRDYHVLDGGFIGVTTAAREYGQDGVHEELSKQLIIKKVGYVYLYLSNDNAALGGNVIEVFFDDFTVEHVKSPVVQQDDYYAFGLEFNSYQRENAAKNNYLYNGKEKQDELDLGWLDYGARTYMADIGRFSTVDPNAPRYGSWNPYNYVANNPILLIDPDGRDWRINKSSDKEGNEHYDMEFTAAIVNQSKSVSVEDLLTLAQNLINQIEDSFTINEDNVTTNVKVNLRISSDGKVKDNEHTIRITDDLPSDEAGKADQGGKNIDINSSQIWKINKFDQGNTVDHKTGRNVDERDRTTGPHEAGHSAGLTHPDERTKWYDPTTWFLPSEQYIPHGEQKNNLMYSGTYRSTVLKQDLSNGGKGYKINANQARIMYENRDNQ